MANKKHVNIPIFIPHMGCKNQCVFCNQRTISGVGSFDINTFDKTVQASLSTLVADDECEIAFFGGSFTGIDRELMLDLLKRANKYIASGRVGAIRCSTRPDYIDDEVLSILRQYGVRTIELGLQSASNYVLSASKRGHDFAEEKRACELILKHGFTLGGQMMIGLPGSSEELEVYTARKIVELGATEARIYPTIVFHGTELCDMAVRGDYLPLSIDDAIRRSASALEVLLQHDVKLLRIGLCESEGLHDASSCYGGPVHPAIGELIFSELFYRKIKAKINEKSIAAGSSITVCCPKGSTSKVIGHKSVNKARIFDEYSINLAKVTELFDSGYDIDVYAEKGKSN